MFQHYLTTGVFQYSLPKHTEINHTSLVTQDRETHFSFTLHNQVLVIIRKLYGINIYSFHERGCRTKMYEKIGSTNNR